MIDFSFKKKLSVQPNITITVTPARIAFWVNAANKPSRPDITYFLTYLI
jgi:hypothetical protein